MLAIDDCAPPQIVAMLSRMANRRANNVTIYTNGNASATEGIKAIQSSSKLDPKARRYISVDVRKITKFVKGSDGSRVEVHLEDGAIKKEGCIAHTLKSELNRDWVKQMGLETTPQGNIKVNQPFNETSVPGVFAVRDCATPTKGVAMSISMKGATAAGLVTQIEVED